MSSVIGIIAVVAASVTTFILMISSNWRTHIGLLAAQYVVAFYLIAVEWPIIFALMVLTSGWMSAAILGLAMINQTGNRQAPKPALESNISLTPIAIISISAIIMLVVGSFSPVISGWIPNLDNFQCWTALIFLSFGLVKLAINHTPVDASFALLTILTGFEILFSGLMLNPVVIVLLISITLFLALSGAFMIYAFQMEESA